MARFNPHREGGGWAASKGSLWNGEGDEGSRDNGNQQRPWGKVQYQKGQMWLDGGIQGAEQGCQIKREMGVSS